MLKKFFLGVASSFVGAGIAIFFFSFISVIFSIALFSALSSFGSSKTSVVEDKSLLLIDLDCSISEREGEPDFTSLLRGNLPSANVGLDQILEAIENAKSNDKISGIYLRAGGVSAGVSTLYEIREAIVNFKKESKKPVYAYGYEGYSQGDYYLASAADSIFINPQGTLDVHGLGSENIILEGAVDKYGIEMQVVRVGTFKSAVEPYMLTEISEANRLQQTHYMGSIWKTISTQMADSRNITVAQLNQYADSLMSCFSLDELMKTGLVDGACYLHEMQSKLRKFQGLGDNEKPRFAAVTDLLNGDSKKGSNVIAVLYAEGEIDGSNTEGIITKDMAEEIVKLANDEDVKALVLRVNSPGGSAFGSEQMWESLEYFKSKGKTFTVSMGDYAASGGYYISSGANRIFARETTITGSIGIFGVVPCVEKFATNTIGIHTSLVQTNQNSVGIGMLRALTPSQRAALQKMVNQGYEEFVGRCAQGRNVSSDSIKKIAEGRVWDGVTAKEIGLVDEFGSLNDAVKWTATKIGCADDYSVVKYPEYKSRWMRMLEKFENTSEESAMREKLGVFYDFYTKINKALNRDHILCIMEEEVKL